MAAENQELRVEEAFPWLPTQVLHEACDIKMITKQQHQKQKSCHSQRQQRYDRPLLSPSDLAFLPNQKSKSGNAYSPPNRRQNSASAAANWPAGGGSGMQAIFLDSGRQLGGTGVFIPRGTGGTGFSPNKKPACSMVLVPARVVQALNLDVQALALGLQTSPHKDPKSNPMVGRECNTKVNNNNNKKGKDVTSTHCSFISQNQTNSSQEIFLPKEWTY